MTTKTTIMGLLKLQITLHCLHHQSLKFRTGGQWIHVKSVALNSSFKISRCTISAQFQGGCQDNIQATFPCICSHLSLSLSENCEPERGSPSEHMLQAFHIVYLCESFILNQVISIDSTVTVINTQVRACTDLYN